ncbi:unnamed protein product [Durusdinium trenchii]|uniref:Uncharacterized protein n=1 Tax=Durusdinium trenchii TaxID=1381693 RepID=A0ABP0IXA7_9DINO
MISCIGSINSFFRWGSQRPSFYTTNQVTLLPFLCPFNYVGLKTAAVRIFGCSEEFWENVIKPFHGLNLSTVHIDDVPGTAFETLGMKGRFMENMDRFDVMLELATSDAQAAGPPSEEEQKQEFFQCTRQCRWSFGLELAIVGGRSGWWRCQCYRLKSSGFDVLEPVIDRYSVHAPKS